MPLHLQSKRTHDLWGTEVRRTEREPDPESSEMCLDPTRHRIITEGKVEVSWQTGSQGYYKTLTRNQYTTMPLELQHTFESMHSKPSQTNASETSHCSEQPEIWNNPILVQYTVIEGKINTYEVKLPTISYSIC